MSKFTNSIAHYCEGLHVSPGASSECAECPDFDDEDERDCADEGRFSRAQCDTCGSTFGGDRYSAHAWTEEFGILHYDVCVDCLFYLANGDEPEEWQQHPTH